MIVASFAADAPESAKIVWKNQLALLRRLLWLMSNPAMPR
jgi:hypothetical protein